VSVRKCYSDEESFFTAILVKDRKTKRNREPNWTEAVKAAKEIIKKVDQDDTAYAKAEYRGDEARFQRDFSWRNPRTKNYDVMCNPAAIARKWRELKHQPRPWDDGWKDD
jgi:hypothetical protein